MDYYCDIHMKNGKTFTIQIKDSQAKDSQEIAEVWHKEYNFKTTDQLCINNFVIDSSEIQAFQFR